MQSAMKHEQKTFYVTNRGLAAVLITKGYEIIRIGREENNKGQSQLRIHFEDSHGLREISDEYWHGSVMVDAKTFNETVRDLNMRIKSEGH